jgi:type IX secretion system PorP/SprF family membrane protein
MKKNLLLIILLFTANFLWGQDPPFSLDAGNISYSNPAYCGVYAGTATRIIHRNQWSKIPGAFNTSYISVNHSPNSIWKKHTISQASMGFSILRDQEGNNGYIFNQISARAAGRVQVLKGTYLIGGIAISAANRKLNFSNLIFSDQIDETRGVYYPTSFTSPSTDNILYPDVAAGLMLNLRFSKNIFKELLIGGAIDHMLEPALSYTNTNGFLHRKLNIFVSGYIENNSLMSNLCFMSSYQGPLKQYMIGGDLNLYSLANEGFTMGCYLRHGYNNIDAIILQPSFLHDRGRGCNFIWEYCFSYDWTVSRLNSSTNGTIEVGIIVHFAPSRFKHITFPCEPSLYYRPDLYYNPVHKSK